MTKPQFAPEPSMEDILASIRKMISDDRAPPRPLPDPMTRTPFPEASSPAPMEPEAAPGGRSASSYGSLSEAIKAAAQPADQRRTLEERISDLLDKGSVIDPLASFAGRATAPAAPSRPAAAPTHGATPGAAGPALPFGTRVPAPDRAPAPAKAAPAAEPRADAQRVIAMPSRYPAAAPAPSPASAPNAAALNGQGHGTPVTSFGSRVAANAAQPAKEPAPRATARTETPAAEPPAPADVVKAAISEQQAVTSAGAPSEALVDAMVELVSKEPASLSVFTSGMAFIKGVSDKGIGVEKSVAAHKKGVSTLPAGPAPHADDGVPELDGAAAELLRPMLRQWLAENMPRIVEAALRSELTSGGKGPGKA